MKAITLTQPWATLAACGMKHIETRSWHTRYRGRIAIHAARNFPIWAQRLLEVEPFQSALAGCNPSDLPRGAILAVCTLVSCVPTVEIQLLDDIELSFGDYSPGRWAWIFTDLYPLKEPVPTTGMLGLWEWKPRQDAIIEAGEYHAHLK